MSDFDRKKAMDMRTLSKVGQGQGDVEQTAITLWKNLAMPDVI